MDIPKLGEKLTSEQLSFLEAFSKSCRHSILAMVNQAQSGHPGGSCSCIDYLALLYSFIVSQSGEKVIVSNGHISPAVYSVLAEMGYIPKEEVVNTFRRIGSIYEGHVTRHVPGVWFGTGPLGVGVSAAAGFAAGEFYNGSKQHVYALLGDGEAQEGQVYEMMHFASKYKQGNFIVFVDYNQVQLTDSLEKTMPIDVKATFAAAKWNVLEVNGHDYQEMWDVLHKAQTSDAPTVILGHTIMGKGIELLEKDGLEYKATWHGKSPKPEDSEKELAKLVLNDEERKMVDDFLPMVSWRPEKPEFRQPLSKMSEIDSGEPFVYESDVLTDCRSAYGKALLDLAKRNEKVLALTADLRGSVKTDFVAAEIPERHIEVGIAEQHMVSCSGGLSIAGFIPFCSTFGAFMTSRAKDQARVNDINNANVKMVATHCGLSVGEDGPTHQAIDDMSSMLGLITTGVIEPADPNQTDRIIRYIASHYGNFYVRMGRHKFPVLTKEDGSLLYGKDYQYEYGRCDVVREGGDVTIAATGPTVYQAMVARDELLKEMSDASIEIVAVSSIKKFDHVLLDSIRKTKKVITVEDHNGIVGLASQLSRYLHDEGVSVDAFESLAVQEYQLSGTAEELYKAAGISHEHILDRVKQVL